MILRFGDTYYLYTKHGNRILGKFKTYKDALKREQEINFFKSKIYSKK